MHECGSIIWIFLTYLSQVYTKERSQVSKASKSKEYQRHPGCLLAQFLHEAIWNEPNSFKIFFVGVGGDNSEGEEEGIYINNTYATFFTMC